MCPGDVQECYCLPREACQHMEEIQTALEDAEGGCCWEITIYMVIVRGWVSGPESHGHMSLIAVGSSDSMSQELMSIA